MPLENIPGFTPLKEAADRVIERNFKRAANRLKDKARDWWRSRTGGEPPDDWEDLVVIDAYRVRILPPVKTLDGRRISQAGAAALYWQRDTGLITGGVVLPDGSLFPVMGTARLRNVMPTSPADFVVASEGNEVRLSGVVTPTSISGRADKFPGQTGPRPIFSGQTEGQVTLSTIADLPSAVRLTLGSLVKDAPAPTPPPGGGPSLPDAGTGTPPSELVDTALDDGPDDGAGGVLGRVSEWFSWGARGVGAAVGVLWIYETFLKK